MLRSLPHDDGGHGGWWWLAARQFCWKYNGSDIEAIRGHEEELREIHDSHVS